MSQSSDMEDSNSQLFQVFISETLGTAINDILA